MRTRCRWCNLTYSAAGHYLNHLREKHSDKPCISDTPLPRRIADKAHPEPHTNIAALESLEQQDHTTDFEGTGDVEHDSDIEPSHDSDIKPSAEDAYGESDFTAYIPHRICRFPERLKAGEAVREFTFSQQRSPEFNHLYPFLTARDYKLARFFTLGKVPKGRIDDFFQDNILFPGTEDGMTPDISFKSGHTLFKQTSRMIQDPEWRSGQVEFPLRPKSEFRYRPILHCIQYLLRQRAFVNNMLWEPIQVFNYEGERMYSEMNTASWWWKSRYVIPIYLNNLSVNKP